METARRLVRLLLGIGLMLNELWCVRYSHEGVHLWNLPLQYVSRWPRRWWNSLYFAAFAVAAMALLTPDLWQPWPKYPAIYFFVGHGGIVVGIAVLVVGRIAPLRNGAVWRAFGMLLGYAALVGAFNAFTHASYMYLCRKPGTGPRILLHGCSIFAPPLPVLPPGEHFRTRGA